MKKLIVLSIMLFCLTSCATSKITTDMGVLIGGSFQESAKKGTVSAEQSIKAWPYISGQMKGLMAANFEYDLPKMATDIIWNLDMLAKQEKLTDEEKGFIIGSFVRLEAIAIKEGWDKYGVSVIDLFIKAIGG